MKEELIKQLLAVYNALDTVNVSGKNNLANLSGSLSIIYDIISKLSSDNVNVIIVDDFANNVNNLE